jgi:hypothetical protein
MPAGAAQGRRQGGGHLRQRHHDHRGGDGLNPQMTQIFADFTPEVSRSEIICGICGSPQLPARLYENRNRQHS